MHLQIYRARDDDFEIRCDRDTAQLIADALVIVSPDDTDVAEFAGDAACTITSMLERFPAPDQPDEPAVELTTAGRCAAMSERPSAYVGPGIPFKDTSHRHCGQWTQAEANADPWPLRIIRPNRDLGFIVGQPRQRAA